MSDSKLYVIRERRLGVLRLDRAGRSNALAAGLVWRVASVEDLDPMMPTIADRLAAAPTEALR